MLAGGHTSQLMHSTDWLPTLCGIAGASMNGTLPLDGHNQWGILSDNAAVTARTTIFHNVPVGSAPVVLPPPCQRGSRCISRRSRGRHHQHYCMSLVRRQPDRAVCQLWCDWGCYAQRQVEVVDHVSWRTPLAGFGTARYRAVPPWGSVPKQQQRSVCSRNQRHGAHNAPD